MTFSNEALTDQPVGLPVDSGEARRPGPVTIEGRFCRIEALDPIAHGEDLWRSFQGDNRFGPIFLLARLPMNGVLPNGSMSGPRWIIVFSMPLSILIAAWRRVSSR